MLIFVAGIIIIATSLILWRLMRSKVWLLGLVVGAAIGLFSCCTQVSTGYTGIVTTFGRVEDVTFEAGFHFKAPWQEVILMDNREQRITFNFEAFSSDIQQVQVTGSANFSIDKATAMTLYRNVGTDYANILITPRLYENTKSVFSRYTAESLVESRMQLSSEILDLMRKDLSGYGLNIISIAIEDIDFTDAFTDAVEAKQVATQTYQRAQTEQQQATMEAEQAAERQRIAAQAEADVAKIQADADAYATTTKAEAEASANTMVSASLTELLVKYVQAQGWNGELPETWVGSGDTVPFLEIGSGTNQSNTSGAGEN